MTKVANRAEGRRAAMRAAGLLFGTIICAPAIARDIQDCAYPELFAPHQALGDFEDLGNSLVMFSDTRSVEAEAWQTLVLVQCTSGNELTMSLGEWSLGDNSGAANPPDLLGKAQVAVREIVGSEKSYTFEEAASQISAMGIPAHASRSDQEACVCRVLYPRDRGTKERYRF